MKPIKYNRLEALERIQPRLPEELQERTQRLLARAKQGDRLAEMDLLDALKPEKDIGVWLNHVTGVHGRRFDPLSGKPQIPAVSRAWRCPKFEECGEWEPLIQAGEEPPLCPVHEIKMVMILRKRNSDAG